MSWVQLVSLISSDVQTRMLAAGYPAVGPGGSPLIDGAILLGPQHVAEGSAPPRIVFVPVSAAYGARSVVSRASRSASSLQPQGTGVLYATPLVTGTGYTTMSVAFSAPDLVGGVAPTASATIANGGLKAIVILTPGTGYLKPPTMTITGDGTGAQAACALAPDTEQLAELQQRAIWSETKRFRVEVWNCVYSGATPTPGSDGDWDATETLAHLVMQSMQALMAGAHRPTAGQWVLETTIGSMGRCFAFEVEIGTPVGDVTLPFAPIGTTGSPGTVQYSDPAGGIVPGDTVTAN